MAVNLHEICRLCLEEIKTPSASLKEGSSLLTKLRRFLPVLKIHPGDGLPILVCDQCESLVNICYNFKLQVERSDSALQKYCISQQFAQPYVIRKDEGATSDANVAGSSYEEGIECGVGVHLLAPLGIGNTSPDNKLAEGHGVVFHKTEQEHSSHDHEKTYADRSPLNLPSVLHQSDSQVHSCGCAKTYKSHHFLDIRNKTHMKEKPYMCAYCGQSFRYMSSLTRHLVVHSGEKRYVCHICNKAFTQEAHLKTHSILHTGEKPFRCSICPMAFSRKGNLKRHQQVHKTDK
ncbi:zinc finger protein 431-like isoform X2 [Periplaneta americana]